MFWGIAALVIFLLWLLFWSLLENNRLRQELERRNARVAEFMLSTELATSTTRPAAYPDASSISSSPESSGVQDVLETLYAMDQQRKRLVLERNEALKHKRIADQMVRTARHRLFEEQRRVSVQEQHLKDRAWQNQKLQKELKSQRSSIERLRQELEETNVKYLRAVEEYKSECMTPRPCKYAGGLLVVRCPKFNYYETYYHQDFGEKDYQSEHLVHRHIARKYLWLRDEFRPFYQARFGDRKFESLIVHHLDGMKYHNAAENLVILTPEEHRRLHQRHTINSKESGLRALQKEGIPLPNLAAILASQPQDAQHTILPTEARNTPTMP